jgi:hypothetical protein
VERRSQDLPTWLLVFLCPTRVLFEWSFVRRRGITIIGWTVLFLLLNLSFLFSLAWLHEHLHRGLVFLLWLIPFSRIFEIGYAFYNDAFDQLDGFQPRSGLKRSQRLKLLGCSYFEVAVCYASLYLACPNNSFTIIQRDLSNLCTSVGLRLRRLGSVISSPSRDGRDSCA